MTRRLILLAMLILLPVAGSAAHGCKPLDWLLESYHLSLSLEQLDQAPEQGRARSRALLALLSTVPVGTLKERLEAEGAAEHAPAIGRFVQTQRMAAAFRLDNPPGTPLPPALLRQAQDTARRVAAILDGLRCTSDPAWPAATVAASQARTASTAGHIPASPTASATAPDRASLLPGPPLPRLPLWLIAIILLLAPFSRSSFRLFKAWKAARRRRHKRFPCHLDCALLISGEGRPRIATATIVDISQTGAKLFLGTSLPETASSVEIILGDARIEARPLWRNTLYAGVQFHRLLPRARLHRLLLEHRDGRRRERRDALSCRELPQT